MDKQEYIKDRSVKMGNCVLWVGSYSPQGKPIMPNGSSQSQVHRVVWELAGKPLIKYQRLYRTCGEAGCINIDHLTTFKERSAGNLRSHTTISK